jgi:hypothetical protein
MPNIAPTLQATRKAVPRFPPYLWDPAEAGYAMVWLAKQVLDKKSVTEGTEIPTIGKIPSLKGNTITYDRCCSDYYGQTKHTLTPRESGRGFQKS